MKKISDAMETTKQLDETLFKLNYASLNPMQQKAISEGFIEEQRVVVCAPTASGKTLLALLAVIKQFERNPKGKIIYVVPLKALASEKFSEFSSSLEQFGIRVGISTGDLDSSSPELGGYDLIIVTSEKMDSLLRHKADWTKQISLAVIDEIHLVGDETRGATLEVVLTKLKQAGCRLICLSATIPNGREISDWLGAKLITSDYRPTELVLGICSKDTLILLSKEEPIDSKKSLEELLERCLNEDGKKNQLLVFVSTRRSAESTAEALGRVTKKYLGAEEKNVAETLAKKALSVFHPPTKQCRMLANCLRDGVAFHHAGIPGAQRVLIEDGFKKQRALKAIMCTTTLAMGIDYPASWVIVKDLKRFSGSYSDYIPKLEVAQMVGRAGRPRYDKVGYGILMCAPKELEFVKEKYLLGPLENIYSSLSSEAALRVHSLSLIATNYCNSFKEIFEFFNSTLYAKQFEDTERMFWTIERAVGELKKMDFVRERSTVLSATPLGKRVSELYLDPLSAYSIVQFIEKTKSKPKETFDYLLALADTTEMRPFIPVRGKEQMNLWDELYNLLDDFELEKWETDDEALEKYKTAKMLNAWINEETEENILEKFDLPPGVLYARKQAAEWLAYGIGELAYLLNAPAAQRDAKRLARRIKHGVKEELLSLCRIKGIGRVRSRRLYNAGIKTAEELKNRSKEEIKKILRIKEETV
ncbi:DEAD/DEAH box helicase [Candidatus Micrarchaeota archaeon]|nr:DEAD/DEAH box helicase [Candidatus Micrarchaeota archaeon]